MKLEVGMYVRIKNEAGWCCIGDIENINDFREPNMKYCIDIQSNDLVFIPEDMIVKASHNIIDLIEVGDFITLGENCYPLQVVNIWEFTGELNIELSNRANFEDIKSDSNFKIYSIVTKEQFESMSYKI